MSHAEAPPRPAAELTLPTLTAMVVGSMVGAGVFSLPRRFAQETGVAGALIAWAVAGTGMLMLAFVFQALFYFEPSVFADNFSGTAEAGTLFDQVRGTMLATVFVFLGVEGASVYSRHAKRREDVGRATVLGFLSVFAVFASVTIVSYGLLPMAEIAELRQPSMAEVLESAVGTWGKVFISVGLIVSVLGAYLAWTLMAAEVLFVAAKDKDMPRFLGQSTAADVPENALLLTTCLSQIVLVVTLFSDDAFTFALDLTSALSLIPFLLAAGFAVKVATRPGRWGAVGRSTRREPAVAVVATLYTAFLLYAAGPKFVLVSLILYAPATFLFVKSRREQRRRIFSPGEAVICAVSVIGAAAGIAALAAGWIEL
ncbi:amino acid permease [Streptomyces griseus]|uniref:amino acid permease n=1 Tax=Streptomyces griseus TaxID=1911 RepID=UPI00342CD812